MQLQLVQSEPAGRLSQTFVNTVVLEIVHAHMMELPMHIFPVPVQEVPYTPRPGPAPFVHLELLSTTEINNMYTCLTRCAELCKPSDVSGKEKFRKQEARYSAIPVFVWCPGSGMISDLQSKHPGVLCLCRRQV